MARNTEPAAARKIRQAVPRDGGAGRRPEILCAEFRKQFPRKRAATEARGTGTDQAGGGGQHAERDHDAQRGGPAGELAKAKLGARDRVQLVITAYEAGLVPASR
jgi:hypothetical protein